MPIVNVLGVTNPINFPNDMDEQYILEVLRKKFNADMISKATGGISDALQPVGDTIAPFKPTLSERLGAGIADTLKDTGIISDNFGAQRIGRNVSALAEFLPGIGDATAGDEFGKAVAQGDKFGMAMAGLGVIPIAGDALKAGIKKSVRYKNTAGSFVDDVSNIDFDMPITHGTLDESFDGVIKKKGVFEKFDGIFGSQGNITEYGGKKQITFFPRKGKVAGEGDSDLDFDQAMVFLRGEYPDADEDTLEQLYDITAGDENVFEKSTNPLEMFGYDDLGEASWEAQNIRGKIAIDQGFDAIAVDDELTSSVFIPKESKAVSRTK